MNVPPVMASAPVSCSTTGLLPYAWVIVPPDSLGIFTIIMLFFYFSIGSTLERTWGAFRFNLYILSGVLFTVIGAFLLYALYPSGGQYILFGRLFSTYYINMSIFLAFALTFRTCRYCCILLFRSK